MVKFETYPIFLMKVAIYTDGSCHSQSRTGAWAAIILAEDGKTILQEVVHNTTHNRMELTAVIKSIEFAVDKYPESDLEITTDSQYVVNLPYRKDHLNARSFITKKGNVLNNSDLLKKLFGLLETNSISFIKVKAHQKPTEIENLNREVDMICRKLMREA